MKNEELRNKIIDWNIKFPIDRQWRKKYNIPFMSKAHRECSFLDQMFDLEEDKIFEELNNREDYVPNIGEFFKTNNEPKTQDELIKEAQDELENFPQFDDIDG